MTRLSIEKSERGVFEIKRREEDILGEVRQMLELNGARVFRAIERVPRCYRCHCWLGSSERGTPDLSGYFYRDGIQPFWIEMKRPKGKHRPAQEAWIAQAKADGAIAMFATSWPDVVRYFEEHGIVLKIK
jgi:hypothetical protein